jgi:hypothetical protein
MSTTRIGLFLGAGASYEIGMPLVWDITAKLQTLLTPERLRDFNNSWRTQGGGYSDAVIDDLIRLLSLPNQHYESILGYLETQFRRHSSTQQEYHGLYSWLIELVYHILYSRHVSNTTYLQSNLHYFEGIAHLAAKNNPLWIFSLNHDLIIECIAAHYKIPVHCGFTPNIITLPRRDKAGIKKGELKAETISADQLDKGGMLFPQHGASGINLLKIHGALDVFTFRDGKDLLRLLPTESSVVGVLDTLRSANEELIYVHPAAPGRPQKITNEIAYADEQGEMQFLRRSLLAGAFKFDRRSSQVLPMQFLDHFRSYINHVTSLVCIGYGFGDNHINQVIRGWLEFSGDRRLEIVGPKAESIPPSLLHLAAQITLTNSTATDYLDKAAGITRSKNDVLQKRFAAWARREGRTAQAKFQAFIEQRQRVLLENIVNKFKSFPWRDGDIDLDALGLSQEELVSRVNGELRETPEDLLETFLNDHEIKP